MQTQPTVFIEIWTAVIEGAHFNANSKEIGFVAARFSRSVLAVKDREDRHVLPNRALEGYCNNFNAAAFFRQF